jgi:hypothetical protein
VGSIPARTSSRPNKAPRAHAVEASATPIHPLDQFTATEWLADDLVGRQSTVGQRRRDVSGLDDGIAAIRQRERRDLADIVIVVDQQDRPVLRPDASSP